MSIRPQRIAVAAITLLALLVSSPGPSTAQPKALSQVPRLFGAFDPEPGVWSEYTVVEKDTGKSTRMRMSIVGKEGDAFWYEVLHDDGENRNVIKMLVQGNPNDPENMKRLIFKSADNPATEMPQQFVGMGRKMAVHMFQQRSGVPAEHTPELRVEDVGERRITVPGGTFETTQHRIVDENGKTLATYDSHPDVRPFGVVISDTENTSMELVAHGRDAKTLITETPALMTTPPGMPEGMPRGAPPGMPRPTWQKK